MSVSSLPDFYPPGRAGPRRPTGATRLLRVAIATLGIVGGLIAGCSAGSSNGPPDPQSSTGGVSPSTVSPAATPSAVTGSPTSAPLAPGTVVPFRTVPAGSAVGKRLALVAPTASDPLGKAVSDSVIAQMQIAGAELIRCDPGNDPALVLDCARRMATQHVDGWIVLQPGGLGEALCDVGPKGVPLIVIAAAPVSCQTASLGADDQRAGFLVGAELGRTSRIRSACAPDAFVIVTNSGSEMVSTQRIEGIREGFTSVCPGPIAEEVLLDAGSQDRAYDAFTNTLTKLPEDADVLVAAVNDGAALGVAAAIPPARAGHIALAAIGADQRALCEIVGDPPWIGDAALFPDRYGDVAVPALLDAIDGRDIPKTMYVQTTLLTAANVSRFYDVGDCPVR